MNKQIEKIDNYNFDERFYQRTIDGQVVFRPSVTHVIGSAHPTDYGIIQWRGDVGNKRADEIFEEAGTDGTFIHESSENMLRGGEISGEYIDQHYCPKRSLKIKRCLRSFIDWANDYEPEVIEIEDILWGEDAAGTRDLKCRINKVVGKTPLGTYTVDFKTTKTIHTKHKIQICAYGLMDEVDHVALLHLGNTTKKGYSFNVLSSTDRERFTGQWTATMNLFKAIYPNAQPTQETFPDIFKIGGSK